MTKEKTAGTEITIGFLAEQWLNNVKFHIKESSYVKYRNLVFNHIQPGLGAVSADEFTTVTAEQFIEEKLKNGKKSGKGGLSEKSVKDILVLLREVISFGTRQDLEIPCHPELIRVRVPEREISILNHREQLILEEYLADSRDPVRIGILLSLHMGLRLGEVCALKKENLLLDSQILQVRSTMQRIQDLGGEGPAKTKIIITSPKSTASIRDIPIPDFMMAYLTPLESLPEQAFLMTGKSGVHIEPRTLENTFYYYLKECRIPKVNYHALRHTFATRCIENGFDIKSLSEILGHTSVNITLNRYVHSSMEQKRKQMNRCGSSVMQKTAVSRLM